jgi:hypothetical protein
MTKELIKTAILTTLIIMCVAYIFYTRYLYNINFLESF